MYEKIGKTQKILTKLENLFVKNETLIFEKTGFSWRPDFYAQIGGKLSKIRGSNLFSSAELKIELFFLREAEFCAEVGAKRIRDIGLISFGGVR